jgi:hypothetical protein
MSNELHHSIIFKILLCINFHEANAYINYLKIFVHAKILKLHMHVPILLNGLYKIDRPFLL